MLTVCCKRARLALSGTAVIKKGDGEESRKVGHLIIGSEQGLSEEKEMQTACHPHRVRRPW